jgi:hypothetical protein
VGASDREVAKRFRASRNSGGPGRLAGLRRRVRPGLKAAERTHLGPPRPNAGGEGDRLQQQARVASRTDRRQARAPALADLPRPQAPQAPTDQRKGFTEADYSRLLDAAHQHLGGPVVVVWDKVNAHVSVMTELISARDRLTVYRLPPYAHELNPVEQVWVAPQALPGQPRQAQPRPAHRLGQDPAQADAVPARPSRRLPRQHRLDLTPFRNPQH